MLEKMLKYKKKFDCAIRIDEPSGNSLILDAGRKSFYIDCSNVDDLEDMITQSLKTGKNILLEKSKMNEVKYDKNVLY